MSARARREKNRSSARLLEHMRHTCPECGEKGKHWIESPAWSGYGLHCDAAPGFWTCAKFYGPDGRRLNP